MGDYCYLGTDGVEKMTVVLQARNINEMFHVSAPICLHVQTKTNCDAVEKKRVEYVRLLCGQAHNLYFTDVFR